MQRLTILMMLLVLAGCSSNAQVEFLLSDETRAMNLPFSDAVRVGNTIILSGQLGVSPENFALVEGGIEPETHQLFANITRVLEANGSGLDDVVKCTVMMADIAEWPRFNEIYVTYFPGDKPARSAFGANGLALGARVEMECWAVVR